MFLQNHICSYYEREESRTNQLFENKNSATFLEYICLNTCLAKLDIWDLIILVSSINFKNFFYGCHLIQDTAGFSNNLDNFLLKREYNMVPGKLQAVHLFYNVLDGLFHILYTMIFNDFHDLLKNKLHQLGSRLGF
jgi:hypothetical protein